MEKTFVSVVPNKQLIGKTFKGASKAVQEALSKVEEETIVKMEEALTGDGLVSTKF